MAIGPDCLLQRENWVVYPVDAFVAALTMANPEECLLGSDWPHIMLADTKAPGSEKKRVWVNNLARLYRFF